MKNNLERWKMGTEFPAIVFRYLQLKCNVENDLIKNNSHKCTAVSFKLFKTESMTIYTNNLKDLI